MERTLTGAPKRFPKTGPLEPNHDFILGSVSHAAALFILGEIRAPGVMFRHGLWNRSESSSKRMDRRLRRLEDRYGPPVETAYSRELQRRIEAGRRRVAEAKGEAYVPLPPPAYVPGLTLADAILRGRDRALAEPPSSHGFRYYRITLAGAADTPALPRPGTRSVRRVTYSLADRLAGRGFSTITTKTTRHLSQPPTQQTHQPSM